MKLELDAKNQKILYLEEKLENMQQNLSNDVVSRSQVEEMESIFVDTINQLSARVMQLEEDKQHFYSSQSSDNFQRNENNHQYGSHDLPRGARIEPGKVRARVEPSMNGWINGKSSNVNKPTKGRF